MLALVVVDTCFVALLAVLVVGLLRSHADILRALHSLGAGVGDPAAVPVTTTLKTAGSGAARPVTIGPALPPERDATSVHDVGGVTPAGDAVSLGVSSTTTLLVFLTSGCSTCAEIWRELQSGWNGLRVVVVTKGPEFESPAEVAAKAPTGTIVVMSTEAWSDYEVPGSPFFVLVDGGRRAGEGVAANLAQVAALVSRARTDESGDRHLDGPAREARNDAVLLAAGIHPGHASLYPTSLDDVVR